MSDIFTEIWCLFIEVQCEFSLNTLNGMFIWYMLEHWTVIRLKKYSRKKETNISSIKEILSTSKMATKIIYIEGKIFFKTVSGRRLKRTDVGCLCWVAKTIYQKGITTKGDKQARDLKYLRFARDKHVTRQYFVNVFF